jgi:hypothetical protein
MTTSSVGEEQDKVKREDAVENMARNAMRCRSLANSASDPEARDALMRVACEIESAISIIKENAAHSAEGQGNPSS